MKERKKNEESRTVFFFFFKAEERVCIWIQILFKITVDALTKIFTFLMDEHNRRLLGLCMSSWVSFLHVVIQEPSFHPSLIFFCFQVAKDKTEWRRCAHLVNNLYVFHWQQPVTGSHLDARQTDWEMQSVDNIIEAGFLYESHFLPIKLCENY